jgi:hypothetical protein
MKELLNPDSGRVGLDRVVELTNRHLGLDVVYIAELTDGRQIYRAVAGDAASFNIGANKCASARGSYCRRLVDGEIPNVIRDARSEERVAEEPMTRDARIRYGSPTGRCMERSARSAMSPTRPSTSVTCASCRCWATCSWTISTSSAGRNGSARTSSG